MGALDRLWGLAETAATIDLQLKQFQEGLAEARAKLNDLSEEVNDLQLRVSRLETLRDVDVSRMEMEMERYRLTFERFELRLKELPSSGA